MAPVWGQRLCRVQWGPCRQLAWLPQAVIGDACMCNIKWIPGSLPQPLGDPTGYGSSTAGGCLPVTMVDYRAPDTKYRIHTDV